MEIHRPQTIKAIPREIKDKGGLKIPGFKLYKKALVSKTVWY